ncbi:alpha/beta hydrolase [Niallia taxi]|uniref:alpha/beta fold hydrolase n=1 Tax=Niallia taxi TaxID=2499688 RepID=UPI003D2BE66B
MPKINFITILDMFLLLLFILLLFRWILANSIRRKHRIHSQHGIDQEVIMEIGGIQQYLYIRGQNSSNPIILFLHGGPGTPMTPVLHKYQYGWEYDYTVVNWDQRNTGRTYFLNKKKADTIIASLTADQVVEDIHEIVLYLSKRFNQDRIIIMGHSWGTTIGSLFVQRYPELTKAYIGISQIVQLNDGAALMAAEIRKKALVQGANKDAEILERLQKGLHDSLKATEAAVVKMYKIAKNYISYMSDSFAFLKAGAVSPYFSLRHLSYFLRKEKLQAPLSEYAIKHDIREQSSSYSVPVIYIVGQYDLHFKYLFEQYYPLIKAPYKNMISIANAGHNVMMDKPDQFSQALQKGLREMNKVTLVEH